MITIGLYKNAPALISSLIRWHTRSVYSHAAIRTADGVVYEALGRGFVKAASFHENHKKAIVDLLEYKDPLRPAEEKAVKTVCERLVNLPYDYLMVLAGFPLRFRAEPPASRGKIFCSEGVFLACAAAGASRLLLERILPWEVSPEHLNLSPLLQWAGSIEIT